MYIITNWIECKVSLPNFRGLNAASGLGLAPEDLAATKLEKHEYKYGLHDAKYPGLEPGDLGPAGLHGADHLGEVIDR